MKKNVCRIILVLLLAGVLFDVHAETATLAQNSQDYGITFPNLADNTVVEGTVNAADTSTIPMQTAIWPFKKKDDVETEKIKPKSTRKAFFLSLLLPGLGEAYVGSKRSIIFFGIEALAIWTYFSNTNKGNDLENDYERFADTFWHYYDDKNSKGETLNYNYWNWLKHEYSIPNDIGPGDYTKIDAYIEEKTKAGGFSSVHSLPSTKSQQYYEMIGKYDQFVYGWEDIESNNPYGESPALQNEDGTPNFNYDANTGNIKSPMRKKYMGIRGDSNDKLKAGQRGIYIMLIDRVISAIDAGRLAYHYNKGLESDLSEVKIHVVEKQIIDHKVPMLMFTKKF